MPATRCAALVTSLALAGGTLALASAQAPSMPGYPALGSPASVTLLSAGSSPRKELRYRIAPDHKASLVMTMDMGFTMGQAGMSMNMPTMRMQADVAVTKVATDGDVTFDLTFTDIATEAAAGMDPSVVAMMQAATAQLKGLKGSMTMSSRGVNKSAALDVSKIADPNLSQALSSISSAVESLSVPLPAEAVGAGARWEIRQAISANGAYTFQNVMCEVVSMEDSAVTLKIQVEQTTPAQSINNPNLPPGASASIDKASGRGIGTTTIRLDNLVPTSESATESSTAMTVSFGGSSQQMTVDAKIRVTISPVK